MADPKKFHLLVAAGPSYDPSTHSLVSVNAADPLTISSPHISADLNVRIQNYRGLPPSSPATSPYFTHPNHHASLYSISFTFTLPTPIKGTDLLFGNDFDQPIRDRLPPGFNAAFRLVRWAIDPGLTGDVQADKPWLYGPLLSSINTLRVGELHSNKSTNETGASHKPATDDATDEQAEHASVIEEGADGESAAQLRHDAGVPDTGAARMKHFLTESHRAAWTFEPGREYACDFFNPYLDFNDLALRLPGITLQLMRFWDGQPLRYVLKEKNAEVERELLVIVFALVPEEEVDAQVEKWGVGGKGSDGEAVGEKGSGGEGVDGKGIDDKSKGPDVGGGGGGDNGGGGYTDEGVD